ncbi:MAG: DUF371 domain-containing protein [Candidatus Methanomethylicaceae archaeon]
MVRLLKKVLVSMLRVTFYAKGDPLITGIHRTTIEITKDVLKSIKGDCVIATRSELALKDLPEEFKSAARAAEARIGLFIEVEGFSEEVWGRGHPSLPLKSDGEIVVRKSGYVCGRTLMIHADKAAADLSRDLIRLLKNGDAKVKLTLLVE